MSNGDLLSTFDYQYFQGDGQVNHRGEVRGLLQWFCRRAGELSRMKPEAWKAGSGFQCLAKSVTR
jgi:hypothetical protein